MIGEVVEDLGRRKDRSDDVPSLTVVVYRIVDTGEEKCILCEEAD